MQLTSAIAIAACLVAAHAHADTGFSSKIQVYADSDHTTVVSPVVSARADVTNDTTVNASYLVDAVSSASVDLVSQASPRTMHDTRHEVSLGASHVWELLTLAGGYSFSRENDYLSHTVGGSLSREFDAKNTTLSLGYGISINTVGRSGDENFARDMRAQHLSATWTQLVSPRLVTQVVYELGYSSGYQASPYRFVPVRMDVNSAPQFWVPETDPDTRLRHSLVLGANRAVGEASSLQADYRFYIDDWGINAHTVGARYFVHLTKNLELRFRERFYIQTGASFYQKVYTTAMTYMAYDRELSALWSNTVGAKLMYAFTDRLSAELKADVFYYYYQDFAPLLDRGGANIGAGLDLTY
jgi:hypothetical protein